MNPVLEKAQKHYQGLGRKEIKVPEWGAPGEPFVVYASPLTVGQRSDIQQKGNADNAEMFVDVLLLKAQDKKGDLLFTPDDRHALTYEVDGRIVSRIALQILAGPSDKDLEKN